MDLAWLQMYFPLFLEGAKNTLLIALATVLLGSILGAILALMKLSKNIVLKGISVAYIEVIRGTPVYVQIMIIYYGLGMIGLEFPDIAFLEPIIGMNFSDFMTCVITLSLNSAAYVAEIIRGGIQSVDKGQMEAARSLGMKPNMAMKEIIFPQAIKNILPALGNEVVVIVKESSIVAVIGIADLMFKARTVAGATFKPIAPYIVAAVFYFIMTFTLSRIVKRYERRLNRSDSH